MLFWRSRLWNSEMDVKRRWLCALLISFNDVKILVDIRISQWILSITVHFQKQFVFFDVTLQHSFEHIIKSIFYTNVNTYLSQCIAASGVKGSGSDRLKFLIQGLWNVALFQMGKAIFCKEYCLHLHDRTVKK